MTTPALIDDLKRDEGLRLKAYQDSVGVWTIGHGHNLEADPPMLKQQAVLRTAGIDRAEAERLLAADIAVAIITLDRALRAFASESHGAAGPNSPNTTGGGSVGYNEMLRNF